jgi:hypothetical protein
VVVGNPHADARLLAVTLYDNGRTVASTTGPAAADGSLRWQPVVAGGAGHYYYAEAWFRMGEAIVSGRTSPVWIDAPAAPGVYLPVIMAGAHPGR